MVVDKRGEEGIDELFKVYKSFNWQDKEFKGCLMVIVVYLYGYTQIQIDREQLGMAGLGYTPLEAEAGRFSVTLRPAWSILSSRPAVVTGKLYLKKTQRESG